MAVTVPVVRVENMRARVPKFGVMMQMAVCAFRHGVVAVKVVVVITSNAKA